MSKNENRIQQLSVENKDLKKEINLLLEETDRIKLIESELRTHQIELELQNEELKQTQYNLVVSRRKYRHLYENAPVGYIMTDINNKIIELNERAASLFRESKSSLLNKDISLFIDNESQDVFYFHLKKLYETMGSVESQIKIRLNDDLAVVRFISSLTTDITNTTFINTTLEDITEKIKFENLLEEERIEYQELVESISDVIFQTDPEGKFIYLSPVFDKLYVYNSDDIISNHFLNFVHPNDIQELQETFQKIILGQINSFEARFIDKDGKFHHQRISAKVKFDNDMPIAITGVMTDITDIKQAEELFKGTFDRSAIGMVLTGKDGRFLRVNYAFLDMLGYTREEFLELSFTDITHPDDFGSSLDAIKTLSKKKSFFIEKRYRRKDGEYIWCQLSTSFIPDSKGSVMFFIANIMNLTERKENEAKIQEYLTQLETSENQLKELIRDKDRFFSIIASDLRSDLYDFMKLTEDFSLGIKDLTLLQMLEKSKQMHYSSLQLVKVLENLLEWSRSQTHTLKYEPQEHDLYQIAVSSILMFEEQLKQKDITLSNKIPKETIAFFDNKMIETVFRNLISNAIKYSQNCGFIDILFAEDKSNFIISIKDNGIGISEEDQHKLFKIGEKIHNDMESYSDGTGLGLILCKEFISLHNGSISVKSKLGSGSTFSFNILKK